MLFKSKICFILFCVGRQIENLQEIFVLEIFVWKNSAGLGGGVEQGEERVWTAILCHTISLQNCLKQHLLVIGGIADTTFVYQEIK